MMIMTEQQLPLFGKPEPAKQERSPSPPGGAQAPSPSSHSPGQLTHSPAQSYRTRHDQRLAELNLRYGATHTYRHMGRLYARGDFTHCAAEDITHNIQVLGQRLAEQPRLTHMGKAYDSDTYQGSQPLDWARTTREIRELYREKLFEIDVHGNVIGEAHDAKKD